MIEDTTICVARFNENIEWLPLRHSIVYNKGDALNERVRSMVISVVPLENLGRESSSYLTHIIQNYDNLSQITVFVQGRIRDHVRGPEDRFIKRIVAEAKEAGFSKERLIHNTDDRNPHWGREWNKNYLGRPEWYKQDNYYGNIHITFVEWFEKMIDMPFPEELWIYPNAIFAVDKDHILSRPKAYYQKLFDNVHWHNDPIEAHFLERSWYYIFNCHMTKESLIPKPQSVLIMQTCDGTRYKPLLDLAEKTGRAYADKHGYSYKRFDGIKVGVKPWHATFNRIYLLEEELKTKAYDWVLYMDADTCFVGLEQSLLPFINKRNYAILGCRGSSNNPDIFWDINAGVLFFNLNHPAASLIVKTWKEKYESVSIEVRNNTDQELFERVGVHLNDQTMLREILHSFYFPVSYVYRNVHYNVFNYDGSLIRQILRTPETTLEHRVRDMKELVQDTLKE